MPTPSTGPPRGPLHRLWHWAVTPPPPGSYPNPVGGFAGLLHPYRRLVLLVALVAVPVLVVVDLVT